MDGPSDAYRDYIKSPAWRRLRRRLLSARGLQCEKCGNVYVTEKRLTLHHLTYERLGREVDADLLVLCWACHHGADSERKAATASRLWDARVSGWADKVYGEGAWDWEPDIEERFEKWLDERDDADW